MKTIFKSNKTFYFILLLVILVTATFHITKNKTTETYDMFTENITCPIEYGESECINGKIYTPFYNPNNVSIINIKLFIPKSNGVDIYNVMAPLEPDKAESLTTADCYNVENLTQFMEKIKLKWCCEDNCYETYMNNTSENVTLSKKIS